MSLEELSQTKTCPYIFPYYFTVGGEETEAIVHIVTFHAHCTTSLHFSILNTGLGMLPQPSWRLLWKKNNKENAKFA